MQLELRLYNLNVIIVNIMGLPRLDSDCEILMNANCEFFRSSQSRESQSILELITTIRYGVNHRNH